MPKPAGRCAVVDSATDEIPHGRQPLPLVEEHRQFAAEQALGCGLRDREFRGVIELADGAGIPQRGAGLPDPLRTFKRDRGALGDEI